MGLPMVQLAVATNANDILARFWRSGRYEKVDSGAGAVTDLGLGDGATEPSAGASDGKQAGSGVKETLSPAMDILVSSNFERLLWYLAYESSAPDAGPDAERRAKACKAVHDWMAKVKSDGRVEVPTSVLEFARRDFVAERISDEEVSYCNSGDIVVSQSYVAPDDRNDPKVLHEPPDLRRRSSHSRWSRRRRPHRIQNKEVRVFTKPHSQFFTN